MTKVISATVGFFLSFSLFAQTFEGRIVYHNTYTSKIPNVTDELFTSMMGDTQEYFFSVRDYKSVSNGTFLSWQLYINAENKLYTKMANAETLIWNDGASNPDEILKAEINKQ